MRPETASQTNQVWAVFFPTQHRLSRLVRTRLRIHSKLIAISDRSPTFRPARPQKLGRKTEGSEKRQERIRKNERKLNEGPRTEAEESTGKQGRETAELKPRLLLHNATAIKNRTQGSVTAIQNFSEVESGIGGEGEILRVSRVRLNEHKSGKAPKMH